MKKIALLVLGILVALMGIFSLIPAVQLWSMPLWLAILEIVLGAAAVVISLLKEKALA